MALQQPNLPYIDPVALQVATGEYGVTPGTTLPPPPPPPPPPVKKFGAEAGDDLTDEEVPKLSLNDRLAADASRKVDLFGGNLPSANADSEIEMEPAQREIPVQPGQPAPQPGQLVDPFTGQPVPVKGVTAPPPPTMDQVRAGLISKDALGFAKAGGVVKSANELSALQGGVLSDEENAALADREAAKIAGAREMAKQQKLLEVADQISTEYYKKAWDIDNVARAAITEQRKRADELANKHIDPGRAFTNLGAFGNIIWILSMAAASQTKNSAQNMNMLLGVADNMVNRDIAAQKADLSNQWAGWEENEKLNADEHKLNLKELGDFAAQKQARYQMLEKALDLKIASMGNEAADRAGLFKIKAALGNKVVEMQKHFADQVFSAGESAKQRENEVYLTRLRNANAIALKQMDIDEDRKKAKAAKEEKDNEKGIPVAVLDESGKNVGAPTGLYAVDKNGNKSTAPLQARDKDEAVKAMAKVNAGNERHSALLIIKEELGKMSDGDLAAKRYTPRFMSAMEQLGYAEAGLYNKMITDKDKASGERMAVGQAPLEDSNLGRAWNAFFSKGEGTTVDNMRGVVDAHLVSEEKQVTDAIKQHLDRNTLTNYKILWKPDNLRSEPAKDTRTLKETVSEYGASQDTVSKAGPTVRQPYDAKTVDNLVNIQGPGAEGVTEKYKQEKAAGALPTLKNASEDKALSQFETDIKNRQPQDIVLLANALVEGKKNQGEPFSDEARFRLVMEARDAIKEASTRQVKAIGEGVIDVKGLPGSKVTGVKDGKDYGDAVLDYLNSDDWKQAKIKYGIRD